MTAFHSIARVTPITQEGVGCPSQLSPKGLAAHNMRLGGPGTRRKNPAKYDAEKKQRDLA